MTFSYIIWRAMKRTSRQGASGSDSARWKMSWWSRSNALIWGVTVPVAYANAHVINTAREAGAIASHAVTGIAFLPRQKAFLLGQWLKPWKHSQKLEKVKL